MLAFSFETFDFFDLIGDYIHLLALSFKSLRLLRLRSLFRCTTRLQNWF